MATPYGTQWVITLPIRHIGVVESGYQVVFMHAWYSKWQFLKSNHGSIATFGSPQGIMRFAELEGTNML